MRPGDNDVATDNGCTCPDEWDDPDCPIHYGTATGPDTHHDISPLHHLEVDWDELWTADLDAGEWLVEPLLPSGAKVVHIYSPRGTGKSHLMLAMAAALATGQPILNRPASPPIRVAYIDAEMSRGSLREYLEELGYGPHSDLRNLRYLVDSQIPFIDVVEGGCEVTKWVEGTGAEVVFIDSFSAVIRGEEESNNTYQMAYNFTLAPLKRLGLPVIISGNSGKDKERGSRGGSRKEDVMDFIWYLVRNDGDQMTATCTKTRAPYIPMNSKVQLGREVGRDGQVVYQLPKDDMADLPVGSMETAKLLDELGLALDVGSRAAQDALKDAGHGRQRAVVLGALRYRKWAEKKRGARDDF